MASRRGGKKRMNRKVLEQLGLLLKDLVTTTLDPQNPLDGGIIIDKEWRPFWSQAASARETTTYLLAVLEQLPLAIKGKKQAVSVEALANTISFITLFLEFDASDRKLIKALDSWDSFKGGRGVKVDREVDEVVQRLRKVCNEQDLLVGTVIGCSQLHSSEMFQRLASDVYTTYNDADCQAAEGSFRYPYIRRRAAESPSDRMMVLNQTVHTMSTLHQQMKLSPVVAKTTHLAQLFMVRQFVSMLPITDAGFLRTAMSKIQRFFFWPKPYGTATRELLELLKLETVAPGANWRQVMLREGLANAVPHASLDAAPASDAGVDRPRRAIYYVLPSGADEADNLSEMMCLEEFKTHAEMTTGHKNPDLTPPELLLLCMSTLHTADPARPLTPEEEAMLRGLTTHATAALAAELLQPVSIQGRKTAEARAAYLERINAVRARLGEFAATAEGQPISLPAELPHNYALGMPATAHIAMDPRRFALPATPKDYNILPPARAASMRRMYSLEETVFPETPVTQAIEKLLEIHNGASADNPVEVRLVIAAGDKGLHQLICAYSYIFQTAPESLKGIRFKFYLVPFVCNRIASFIAYSDAWYNRHVYAPFRSPRFIVPVVGKRAGGAAPAGGMPPNMDMGDDGDAGTPAPPGDVLRTFVDYYVREAHHVCNVHLYKMEGWSDPNEELPNVSMPFAQRFEIGLVAEARRFQETAGLPMTTPFADIVKDKRFEFEPPRLVVEFNLIDVDGNATGDGVQSEQPCQYQSILASNVPRQRDKTHPPVPSSGHLEVFAAIADQSKSRARVRGNALLNDPHAQTNEMTITVTDQSRTFHVRIDGHSNFGPFAKVRISPLTRPNGERLTLPVQTFLPFDL